MSLPRIAMLTLLLALPLTGCGGDKAEGEKKEEPSIPVEVGVARLGAIDAAYRGTATLEAEDEAIVNAKTAGVIEQILAEEGQDVKAGQVLAQLETDKLKFEVARAKATLDNLEQAFKRNESVYQRNLVSREAYEKTKSDLDVARAAYDLASLALRESAIRAPFDGVVSLRYVKIGNMIQPNSPAFRVTRMSSLQAQIFVPERDIHKLAAGQPAALVVDAWPGRQFSGKILRVNPVVDASSGTVKVTVAMAADQPELKPGMFGRIEIRYDRREQALLIPHDAVLTEDAAQSVFVVADGRARRRAIRTGYSDADHYEVLEGLKAGEQVVTIGQSSLKDDAKVEIVTPGGPAAPAAAATSSP